MNPAPNQVLVPGWASSQAALLNLQTALASHVDATELRCFYPHEVSGHANPSRRDQRSDFADALLATLEAPCAVIGWSMGGMIAMEAAAAAPDRVSALVLLATSPRFCRGHDYRVGFPKEQIDTLQRDLDNDQVGALRRFNEWCAHPFVIADHALERQVQAANEIATHSLQTGLDYLRSQDLREVLPRITVPTLVIHGRKDAVVPWRGGKLVADTIPGAHWILIDNAGHDFPMRSACPVADHINRFLASLEQTTLTN